MEANVNFVNNTYSLVATANNYKFEGNYNKYDKAIEIKCNVFEDEQIIGQLAYIVADNGNCNIQCQIHNSKLIDVIAQLEPLIAKIKEEE